MQQLTAGEELSAVMTTLTLQIPNRLETQRCFPSQSSFLRHSNKDEPPYLYIMKEKRSRPTRRSEQALGWHKSDNRKPNLEGGDENDDKAGPEEQGQPEEDGGEEDFTKRKEGEIDQDGQDQTFDWKREEPEKSRRRPTKHACKVSKTKYGDSNGSRSRGGSGEDVGIAESLRSHNAREDDKKSHKQVKIGHETSDENVDVNKSREPVKRKADGRGENGERLDNKTPYKQVRYARSEGVPYKKSCEQDKLIFDAADERMADNKTYQQNSRDKRTADRRMSDSRSGKQDKPVCDGSGEDIAENREQQGKRR